MNLSSSEVLWASFGIAISVAFAFGWKEKVKGEAYIKAMVAGTLVAFLPSCVAMAESHRAAEEVFWRWPAYLLWFAIGPIAVAYARLINHGDES